MTPPEPVRHPLTVADLPDLMALARRVQLADGGLPAAATEPFLRRRYLDGVTAGSGWWRGRDLVAAAALRPGPAGPLAATLADPAWAAPGLTAVLDWIFQTTDSPVRVETEAVTGAADELLRRRGLHQTFAEDVLRLDLATLHPVPEPPPGVALHPWSAELAPRFFAVYAAAFADRPGFPGWTFEEWTEWIVDDEFAPQWSLLASQAGVDAGFVACARDAEGPAFVVQVGVVPAARGLGLGAALTGAALSRMRSDGAEVALLDVNVNNPGAARVYYRLGFVHAGRRGHYTTG